MTRPSEHDQEANKFQTELNELKERVDGEIGKRVKEQKEKQDLNAKNFDLLTSFKEVIDNIEPRFMTLENQLESLASKAAVQTAEAKLSRILQ